MVISTVDHHRLTELTFKDKTPQGMEHVWVAVTVMGGTVTMAMAMTGR